MKNLLFGLLVFVSAGVFGQKVVIKSKPIRLSSDSLDLGSVNAPLTIAEKAKIGNAASRDSVNQPIYFSSKFSGTGLDSTHPIDVTIPTIDTAELVTKTGSQNITNKVFAGGIPMKSTSTGASTITDATVALKIAPAADRNGSIGSYYGGIGFAHLYGFQGNSTYNSLNHAWIGTRLTSTSGSELDALVFATKIGTNDADIPVERLTILPNGNVGIGQTNPSYLLEVAGTAEFTTPTRGGVSIPSISSTSTFTNKRWTARVGSATSSATPTINTDNFDVYKLTAQAADITSFTTNLTGTPVDGDILEIQITGTAARAITWGSSFVSSTVTLPTTTVTTATLTVVFQYFTTSSYGNNKWICANSF